MGSGIKIYSTATASASGQPMPEGAYLTRAICGPPDSESGNNPNAPPNRGGNRGLYQFGKRKSQIRRMTTTG
jgi:hypothetical protein